MSKEEEKYLTPEAYLPHRAPMNLIDRVVRISGGTVVCETRATPEGKLSLFRKENGSFTSTLLIELMAQTVGVWAGERRLATDNAAKPAGEQDAELGLLLSARNLKIKVSEIEADSLLTTTMNLLIDESRLTSFEGSVSIGEKVIATGRLNVFQPTKDELKALFPKKHENKEA